MQWSSRRLWLMTAMIVKLIVIESVPLCDCRYTRSCRTIERDLKTTSCFFASAQNPVHGEPTLTHKHTHSHTHMKLFFGPCTCYDLVHKWRWRRRRPSHSYELPRWPVHVTRPHPTDQLARPHVALRGTLIFRQSSHSYMIKGEWGERGMQGKGLFLSLSFLTSLFLSRKVRTCWIQTDKCWLFRHVYKDGGFQVLLCSSLSRLIQKVLLSNNYSFMFLQLSAEKNGLVLAKNFKLCMMEE